MSELDAALACFQQRAPEFGPGLANHGPMACEALLRLGHEALVPGFVERYAPRLPPRPRGVPIPEPEQVAARGDPARMGDWIATWLAAFERTPWRALLAEKLPGLLPGCFAAAAHGLLRVAHGVRALDECETPERLGELAHGLALWCARFQTLPGEPGSSPRGLRPAELFAAVPVVPPERRSPGLFFEAVHAIDAEAFGEAVARLELAGEPDAALREVCREAARRYLANPASRIAYVHTVTAPSALRLLAPLLPPSAQRAAVGYAVQAAAALHAVSHREDGGPDAAERSAAEALAADEAEIRYRAACSLDEHAIKLAEACLREDRLAPDPVHRLAAADAALHIGSGAQRAC